MIVDHPANSPSDRSDASPQRDWEAIEQSPDFKALVASRRGFAVPALVISLLYFFALPLLSGYAPEFMATPVIGPINIANLFALSEFAMVAIVMSLYVARAKTYDTQADAVITKIRGGSK